MESILVVFMSLSLLMSGLILGIVYPLIKDLNLVRKELKKKVDDFDEITRKASESNLSLANKILLLEDKIANFEFWKSNTNPRAK